MCFRIEAATKSPPKWAFFKKFFLFILHNWHNLFHTGNVVDAMCFCWLKEVGTRGSFGFALGSLHSPRATSSSSLPSTYSPERYMAGKSERWQKWYAQALQEADAAKQLNACKHARRLIQHRMIEIASAGAVPERDELEAALRQLLAVEKRMTDPGEPGGWIQ
jgi:hypothetical protein